MSGVQTPVIVTRHPLAMWHLLSLDAPTVATLWTLFIARIAGVWLPWTEPAAMFVAVWMLYAADRLLDARPLPSGEAPAQLEERHRFHDRHRRGFVVALCVAATVLLALLARLDSATLRLELLIAVLLGTWLLLVHARATPGGAAHRLPKELAVGVFFPAAIFVPTVTRVPQLKLALLVPALLFGAVCTLNCVLLYAWEHPHDRSLAHASTRWAARRVAGLAATVMLAAGVAAGLWPLYADGLTRLSPPHAAETHLWSPAAFACLLSAWGLLLLHNGRRRWSPVTLRALADLVLLSPLPLWPLLHRPG